MAVSTKSYNLPLNGYRGLCALAVFLFHVGSAGILPLTELGAWGTALASLRYGVELFFMISGFVIAGSLQRHADLGLFLRDRFIRIYAAWAPSVMLVGGLLWALQIKVFENVSPLRASAIFLLNLYLIPPFVPEPLQTPDGLQPYVIPASWSLTYEWVFYLAAAAAVALHARKSGVGRVLRWALAALTVAFVIAFPRALFFVPGLVVFRYRSWFERHASLLRWPVLSLITFLYAWLATGADKAELTETMLDWVRDGRILPAALALIAAVHMFASITLRATPQFAFLETRAFQFLGKISFSFYLWNATVIWVVKRVVSALIVPQLGATWGFACLLLGALMGALTLSWVSWALCEVKLARFLRQGMAWSSQPKAASLEIQPADAE